ncbi:MAG: hypothetical protein ACI80F_002428 [Natronomonas sp.]|jgi:hypothetical protein
MSTQGYSVLANRPDCTNLLPRENDDEYRLQAELTRDEACEPIGPMMDTSLVQPQD